MTASGDRRDAESVMAAVRNELEGVADAEAAVATLTDRGRGLLASALLTACGGTAAETAPVVVQLRLDSTDPSLMSRADVAQLLEHLRAHDAAALRRALVALAEHPETVATLDGLFAPSRGRSDTSNLGGDPTSKDATQVPGGDRD